MNKYIPLNSRTEWKDVVPVPQDDGENPIVPIAYSSQFRELMDYFRAIMLSKEYSERALKLTEEVIYQNAASYTAWYYRRQVLVSLGSDLNDELIFLDKLVLDFPKNYQIWHHRREIVELLNDGSKELSFSAVALKDDEKNYHAWSHRQWAIKRFDLWEKELEFIDDVEMLHKDLRNNSAWNQRWFVISNTLKLTDEVVSREVQYAIKFIKKAPNNESPWNYLRGLMRDQLYFNHPEIKEECIALQTSSPKCKHNNALLVEIYQQENSKESNKQALLLARKLADELDIIRKKYWEYRITTIPID